jgi:hypothetical protein
MNKNYFPQIRAIKTAEEMNRYCGKKKYYFHATNKRGLIGILESQTIGTNYFGEIGVYLAKDYLHSFHHGQYVLLISNLNANKITKDNVNDGLLYKGAIDIQKVESIIIYSGDRRLVEDLVDELIEIIENE